MAHDESDNGRTRSFVALIADTTVLHYKIISKIGSGGMGEVYLAEDTELDRKVALKFLPAHLCQDETCRARFKREAQATARLNHPSIVTIHDVSEFQGRPFFAMEYVSSKSLKDYQTQKQLTLSETIDLAIGICEGLWSAHQAGVIHRDIKPSNILIDASGRPKIVDFGIAQIRGKERLTATGSTLGTVEYMSPEQARGTRSDARSDVFSVGVVLYEMITGRLPFSGEHQQAVIYSILHQTPEPLARYKSGIPAELEHILDKALKKDPVARYQAVAECLADLRSVKARIDSGTARAQPVLPSARVSRRRRLVFGAVAVGVLGVLWFSPYGRQAVLRLLGADQTPAARHLVVLPFTSFDETPSSRAFCDGVMETLTSKLTELEQFHGSLWVVPACEVRQREVVSASQARRTFGATLAVTGSVQNLDGDVRMTLNLIDTRTQRQLRSSVIDDPMASKSLLQDSTVIVLAEMLQVHLRPEEQHRLMAGGTTVREAYHDYVEARGYLARYDKIDNIDTALGLFEQALESDPAYALAFAGLGEAYWRKYEILAEPRWEELAIYNSQRAIELNDEIAPVYVTMGVIYQGKGRYDEAIQKFEQALALDSASRNALRGLAATYTAHNMAAQAESTYQRVIQLWPDYWAGYTDLGLFYCLRGRREEGLKQLELVTKLEHEGYDAWNNLGALYFELDRRQEARAMWERSLEIQPNYGAYSNLGALHYMEDRFAEAAHMYRQALKLGDHDYRLWINLASALYHLPGQDDSMRAAYEHAIGKAEEKLTINPRDPEVLSHLADCYTVTGEHTRALSLVQQALALAPDNLDLMIRASIVYEQLGSRDTALVWVARALDQGYPRSQLESLPEMRSLTLDPRYQHRRRVNGVRPSGDNNSQR